MATLKIAAVFADKEEAGKLAKSSQCLVFEACAETTAHLPFGALVLGDSESLMDLKQRTDVGLYLVNERAILNQPLSTLSRDTLPVIAGIFPMVANQILTPKQRTPIGASNAPIALDVHTAMTHYYQLSVLHRFSGEDWNGLALCCFANEDDLRNKFYGSPEGARRVATDVAKFADTKNSPRRVVTRLV